MSGCVQPFAVEHHQVGVGRCPTAAAPSLAWASSGVTVTSILAFESVSCLAMSLAVNSALMVVAVAPDRRMPWNATAKPELFGDRSPTTSPTPMPRPASAPANASMRADHLAVGGLPAGLRVDQGDPVEVGVVDVGEQEVVDAGGRDVDFGEGTRETHGASDRIMACGLSGQTSSSCLMSFLGAIIRNDASISSRTSSQSTFLRAVKSSPSQPKGPM